MNSMDILLEKILIFRQVFLKDFNQIGFVETQLNLQRLDSSGKPFPDNSIAEYIWSKNDFSRYVVFRVYDNYYCDIEIINTTDNKRFSFNEYKSFKNINHLEIHLMPGNINVQYYEYINKLLKYFKTSEIWNILLNSIWIEIPFNWQNQK